MPPNSTQNLNAKLSLTSEERHRPGRPVASFAQPPIHTSRPPVQIVGGPVHYRGGYHLSI